MNYQKLIDKCRKYYRKKDLKNAYQYWCKIHDLLLNKLDSFDKYDEKNKIYYRTIGKNNKKLCLGEIMEKQFDELLIVYKDFIKVFNNWETTKNNDIDYANYDLLIRTYHSLTDLLVWNNVIEKEGIKHYRVIKTGEII